jgi:hypothetical protein
MPSHPAASPCVEGLAASPGLARNQASQVGEGIARIRRVVSTHSERVEAPDRPPAGLRGSGRLDVMDEELDRPPSALSGSPRLPGNRAGFARGRILTHVA